MSAKNSNRIKKFKKYSRYYYAFGFCLFAYVLLKCNFEPEWLTRLILQYVCCLMAVGWSLWLGLLSPASTLVVPALLQPDLKFFRFFWEGFARLLFAGMAIGFMWGNIIPVSKDIFSLIVSGPKVLVSYRETVEKVDELGPTGFVYQIVYVVGRERPLNYFWGFGNFLREGSSYQFLMLEKSGSILQVSD